MMSDFKSQRFLQHFGVFVFAIFSLAGCVSSGPDLSPGNPLPGIGLAASQNTVLLSWTPDSPLARSLRPGTRINVLAEYNTEYGPVTNEVLAYTNVVSGINGVKLTLKDSLNFAPDGGVCMRLAIGQRPIPVRIARLEESSSGFYYDEWADSAALQSNKAELEVQLRKVQHNIRNFSQPNPNFARWQQENQIFNARQCSSITFVNEQGRPETALEGRAKVHAAKQQCVALYEGYSRVKLPDIEALSTVLAENPAQRSNAKQILGDFQQYSPGRVYFPGSSFPLDEALVTSMMYNKGKLSAVQAGIIVEAYQACETEATTRFEESLRDWQEVTNSATVAARTAPLQKLCQARFSRDLTRQKKLEEFKLLNSKLENEMAALEQQRKSSLPQRKQLVSFSCPAERS